MPVVDFGLVQPLLQLLDYVLTMSSKGAVEPLVLVRDKTLQIGDCCFELFFTEVVDVGFAGGLAPRLKDAEVLSGDLAECSEGVELPCKVCKGEFSS